MISFLQTLKSLPSFSSEAEALTAAKDTLRELLSSSTVLLSAKEIKDCQSAVAEVQTKVEA